MYIVRHAPSVFFLMLVCGMAQIAYGEALSPQASVTESAASPLTVEQLDLSRKAADESSDLDDATKKKVAEIYQSARKELQRATELTAQAASFKADVDSIGQRVTKIKQQIEALKGKEVIVPEGGTLPELEQAFSKLEVSLAGQKKALASIETELTARANRRKEIRARQVAIGNELTDLQKQRDTLPAGEHAVVIAARRMELAARRMARERETPALENELAKYDTEDAADLVRLRRDLCTQEVARAERQFQLLREQIKRAQTVAANLAVRKSRDELIAADPVLVSYAERNRHLAEVGRSITEKFSSADRDLKAAEETYDQLSHEFEGIRKKVESVGLIGSVGALLRKQRAALPDVRKRMTATGSRRRTIDQTQFELLEYDDERQDLANPELPVQRILANAGVRHAQNLELLEAATRELFDRKREYLDALIHNYNKYFDTLVELDATDQKITSLVKKYQQYIDERVLWIRSGNPLVSEWKFDQSDSWLIDPQYWAEIPQQLLGDVRENRTIYGFALLGFAILLVRRRRLRRRLGALGEIVQRPTCRRFAPTLQALGITVFIAGLWPGLVGFVAWRLNLAANGAPFAKASAHGLCCLCAMWFPLEWFRQICRVDGLAEAHFAWPTQATRLLRKNLQWLILLSLPLTFATTTFFAGDPTHGRDVVQRSCFILQGIALAIILHRVLRPRNGVFRQYIACHQGGWIDRIIYIWYWIAVTAPVLLAGLAFWGYYYTAYVLSWRLYATMCFVGSLVLVRALFAQLILLRRRKLSMEQAKQRAAAAAQSGEEKTTLPPIAPKQGESQADLLTHSIQTQRLLATGTFAVSLIGLWLIWVDVLPALRILDQWPLWTTTTSAQVVDQTLPSVAMPTLTSTSASEDPIAVAPRTEYRTTSITFSDLALAVLIAIITFMFARNVPGFLEISVLRRLPLDASVRYAIATLVSYFIVLIGVILTCSNIGLRWPQVQWLATALTFGLAFGLQEIFGNFVAGLIILFERPLRVGDVVTVDDVTGIVSRIRIRATSIVNWDRKEYIVPNKEFITGRLLNWTLSDQVNRVVVNVGIAYGSDTHQAWSLLLNVAKAHPLILDDPPPVATLEGFGDNSLNFTLRAFLPTLDNRLQVIHDLHTEIDRVFRKAAIEIAYPQLDLHVRSAAGTLVNAKPADCDKNDASRQKAA